MKLLLGIELVKKWTEQEPYGEELFAQRTSLALSQALESVSERAEKAEERGKLPLLLRIVQGLCGFAGALIALGILRAMLRVDGVSLVQAYENAGWMFWLAGGCLIVWGILKLCSSKVKKTKWKAKRQNGLFPI